MNTVTDLWTGEFADHYHDRNRQSIDQLHARMDLWEHILPHDADVIMEVGAGMGNNVEAIRALYDVQMIAVEPNAKCARFLQSIDVETECDTAARMEWPDNCADLVFTCGCLIHIPPEDLLPSMRNIFRCSRKYIVCVEYFSDKPEVVEYHGHKALWKQDFGSLWLDNFPLECIDYGFSWKRKGGVDNSTWWLFKKG